MNIANIRLAPRSEEGIPDDLFEELWDSSTPVGEDDARDLHRQLQAS